MKRTMITLMTVFSLASAAFAMKEDQDTYPKSPSMWTNFKESLKSNWINPPEYRMGRTQPSEQEEHQPSTEMGSGRLSLFEALKNNWLNPKNKGHLL